jgi:hypothetical protein
MANYLTMPKKQHVFALLALGWSYRRIQAETGVRRETVSGYDRQRQANPATTFPGSEAAPASAEPGISVDDAANPAKTFAGSTSNPATTFAGSPRFSAARYHDTICEKLDARLSAQRIWQDLVEDFGYGASYESIKRYIRTLPSTRRAVGVFV